ncbi:anthocyanidin 5,3-O-glucosyltransferase-like [Ananas comosus]|uniref:Anthocyanidin 5,3-O-glucosyltransferase-like n=1 Tax=Ananas comosus TaxID=4615 RepID=A0A6P5EBS1_ANACO|nr:anthocyanidin 5,3-O-glucosyltransferase-like [Ananas comosus]
MSTTTTTTKPTVVLFPSPGMGHLVSMVELGELLLRTNSLSVTILTLDPPFHTGATATNFVARAAESHPDISFLPLDAPTATTAPSPASSSPHHEALAFDLLRRSVPSLLSALRAVSLSSPVRALVLDFFCTDALDAAAALRIPAYFFFTSSASALAAFLHLPFLHSHLPSSFKDMGDTPVAFPGHPDIPASHMPLPMLDRADDAYKGFIRHFERMVSAQGILVNTFEWLEPRALGALRAGLCVPGRPVPPVYCVGPLTRGGKSTGHECLRWLDAQPRGSVVFLCFGSLGVFTAEQLREIATGLERSGHRFLWVVRASEDPNRLFTRPAEPDLGRVLPEGFVERTKERGLVVKTWAPQVEVLRHAATGGFVTHCGWNSVLEGICAGAAMIAWPLYAEQRMNKVVLVQEWGLGLGIEGYDREDGVVGAAEVERKVRMLMEGEEGRRVRERVAAAKDAAAKAVAERGASREALNELVRTWIAGEVSP